MLFNVNTTGSVNVKLAAGKFRQPATLSFRGDQIWINTAYAKPLIAEIKALSGAKWHGFDEKMPIKMWSVKNDDHNIFRLLYLAGVPMYARYDLPLDDSEITWERPLFEHQKEITLHFMKHRYCIAACEMGTGKSLAAIEAVERLGIPSNLVVYIGPRAGVEAFSRELRKWKAKFFPRMLTYEKLTNQIQSFIETPPRAVIFDESSKIKTPTAARSQAAMLLANAVRNKWEGDGLIVLMTGTPAPKTPVDWFHQVEVACPGFLKEGDINKFKKSLCIVEERRSITGGVYPHVVTWLDDETKCAKCGLPAVDPKHDPVLALGLADPTSVHTYTPSVNEVSRLYQRMRGLVLVKNKKDCLDLPDKQYRLELIMPRPETIRMMQLIAKSSARAIEALTLTRELSDGFQYDEIEHGTVVCPQCKGVGETLITTTDVVDTQAPITDDSVQATGSTMATCDRCGGTGEIPKTERVAKFFGTPKDDYLLAALDEHEDVGRLVVWAGFTGSIDRLTEIVRAQGWYVLRVDGRGFHGFNPDGGSCDSGILLDAMDGSHPNRKNLEETIPRLCFIGHPQAGGMALTLTSSPTAIYYSNPFSGEARMQSEDRGHRAGMDVNRGFTIVDLIHLPTDQLVLDNLKKKRKLQALTLGEIEEYMKGGSRDNA